MWSEKICSYVAKVGQRHIDVLDSMQIHRGIHFHLLRRLLHREILSESHEHNAVKQSGHEIVDRQLALRQRLIHPTTKRLRNQKHTQRPRNTSHETRDEKSRKKNKA